MVHGTQAIQVIFRIKVDVKIEEDNVTYKITSTANIDVSVTNGMHMSGSLTKTVKFSDVEIRKS